ncbi:MAG: ABC transporter substrate-binding protein [Chloroflexi bacterium]|nr:ABC transporter substrate-binding protein [Chloroflexota bacterium]
MRTGQVLVLPSWVEPSGPQVSELLKQEPKFVAQEVVQSANLAVSLNLRAKPWDDIRVRRAANLAIDREAVAKVVRGGFYPGYGYVVPRTPWTLPEEEIRTTPGFRQPKAPDVAEAKRLLAEAGYSTGLKTTLLVASTIANKEASEALQNELAKVGVEVTIRVVEQTVLNEWRLKRQFEAAMSSESPVHSDPDVVLGGFYLTGSPMNYGDWSNAKFDELFVAQSTTLDMAKRVEIVREMQRIIHQEAPKISLTWAKRWAVWAPEVKNWKAGINPYYNHKMDLVWLDK